LTKTSRNWQKPAGSTISTEPAKTGRNRPVQLFSPDQLQLWMEENSRAAEEKEREEARQKIRDKVSV
jgi:hypothetical protein